jgi:hypothetical protein
MNKHPTSDNSRVQELESELLGEIYDQTQVAETGTRNVQDQTTSDMRVNAGQRAFHIKQGKHLRHPEQVLHRFDAIKDTTQSIRHAYEQALVDSTDRYELPEEYQFKGEDDGMMVDQIGIAEVARRNFASSQGLLGRLHGGSL